MGPEKGWVSAGGLLFETRGLDPLHMNSTLGPHRVLSLISLNSDEELNQSLPSSELHGDRHGLLPVLKAER